MDDREDSRLQITRRVALAGGGAGLAATLLAACGSGGTTSSATETTRDLDVNHTPAAKIFGSTEVFRFTVVNYETHNPFFLPLKNGLADACALLGCRYEWVGSANSQVSSMITAIDRAVAAKVDGIATTLIERGAFDAPLETAIGSGIPVVAYNTDVADSPRLSYIGQNLTLSGETLGRQIADRIAGGGTVVLLASTPGTANIQPRIDGIKIALRNRPDITVTTVATGTTAKAQLAAVQNYMQLHPDLAGYFGIDAGSTTAVAQTMAAEKLESTGAIAGGFDATAATIKQLAAGNLNFVVNQQPYLQGFMTILELYLYRVSDKLVGIADIDTGLQLLTVKDAAAFEDTLSRFEGTSTTPGVQTS